VLLRTRALRGRLVDPTNRLTPTGADGAVYAARRGSVVDVSRLSHPFVVTLRIRMTLLAKYFDGTALDLDKRLQVATSGGPTCLGGGAIRGGRESIAAQLA